MNITYWGKSLKSALSVILSAAIATPMMSVAPVLAAPVDSSPPTVSITSPINNATVSGMVTIAAAASDAFSACVITLFGQQYDVSAFRFLHPGGNIFVCGTDMTAIYQAQHGTNVTQVQPYLIPSTYIGVSQVEFYIDGVLRSTDVMFPYSYVWDTNMASNGLHVLMAKAYDQAGNVGSSATVNVTVDNPIPQVLTSISVVPASSTLAVGATQQLSATARDQFGSPMSPQPVISWSSSNSAKAAVSSSGLVTAMATGTATITASSGSVSGTSGVTVMTPSPGPVLASIFITPASKTIKVGKQKKFVAHARDQNGNNMKGVEISWMSSNTAVATVGANGIVTALSPGSVVISAKSGDVIGTANLIVKLKKGKPVIEEDDDDDEDEDEDD